MLNQVILCFPVGLLLMAVLYFIGFGTNKALKIFLLSRPNQYLDVLGHVAIGCLITASFYAIAMTHGKSIFVGAVTLIIIYKLLTRLNPKSELQDEMQMPVLADGKTALITAFIFLCSYALIILQHLPALKTGYPLSNFDYQYYAIGAKAVGLTGVENTWNTYFSYSLFTGTLLYHYLDLWLTDLVARLTGFNHLIVLPFIIYPMLLTLVITGAISLASIIAGRLNSWYVLAVIGVLTGVNLYFTFYKSIPLLNNFGLQCFMGCFLSHKLYIIYVLILCSLAQLMLGNSLLSAFWLLQMCFAYSTSLPAVCGGIMLTLLFVAVLRLADRRILWQIFTLLMFTAIYTVVFDKLFSERARKVLNFADLPGVKTLLIVTAEYYAKLIIVFVPGILLLLLRILLKIKFDWQEKIGWLFWVVSSAVVIPFVVINHKVSNVSQAIYNVLPPVFIVLSVISVVKVYYSAPPVYLKWLVISVLAVIATYNFLSDFGVSRSYLIGENEYSVNYIQTCLADVNKTQSDKSIINVVSLNDDNIIWWFYNFYQKGCFLFYSPKILATMDLSPYMQGSRKNHGYFDNPDNSNNPVEKWFHKTYPGREVFDEQILLDYLKTNNVKYMVIEPQYHFSDGFMRHLALVSQNAKTGESFYRTNL